MAIRPNEIYDIYKDNVVTNARSAEYKEVLSRVQAHCAKNYAKLVSSETDQDTLRQLKDVISAFLVEENLTCENLTIDILSERILADMAGYSILAKYIYEPGVEEVNVNAYDDIEVIYSSGKSVKVPEKFNSPQQALDVVRRMLSKCGMVLDDTIPSVLGYLEKNIRISADKPPIVDEDVGINVSIRIVNQAAVTRQKLLDYGAATEEMLDFLEACIKHGVSVCFAGATSSGKTTLMAWLLSCIPNNQRLITIEEGSRELNCIKRDEDGNVINSVVHLLTRPHSDPVMNIDQDILLERTLRKNPNVIGVGEMRSYEAMTAAEASRTGHTVTTTIHSNSAPQSYRRMMTLAKKKFTTMDDSLLMQIMVEAFPIVVYTKQLEDGSRHIMEIIEGISFKGEELTYNTLYEFDITKNEEDDHGNVIIDGEHRKVSTISSELQSRFLDNGLPSKKLEVFLKEG